MLGSCGFRYVFELSGPSVLTDCPCLLIMFFTDQSKNVHVITKEGSLDKGKHQISPQWDDKNMLGKLVTCL